VGRHRPHRNLIHVRRNWDRQAGFVAPTSRSGSRRVPITATLRRELQAHRLQQGTGGQGFVFPNQPGSKPFNPGTLKLHTEKAWADAGLTPIGLHECLHSYATYMIAAGINSKALSTHLGHSSITITLDRYGHLLPGNETQAGQLLDTWLFGRHTGSETLTAREIAACAGGPVSTGRFGGERNRLTPN
jgi:integrase